MNRVNVHNKRIVITKNDINTVYLLFLVIYYKFQFFNAIMLIYLKNFSGCNIMKLSSSTIN